MARLGDKNEMVDIRRMSTVFWRLPPAGTLAGFSAYAALQAEGKLDNDDDADILTRVQADGRYVDPDELSAAITAHEGAADPHPVYLTDAEHTAIGNSSPHHAPVTLGATNWDAAHSLTGQDHVLSQAALDARYSLTGHTHAHGDLTGVSADQHHPQAHAFTGADHTVSGLAAGQLLAATSATTFGFTSWTLAGVASQAYTLPSASATLAGLGIAQTFTAAQTIQVAGTQLTLGADAANYITASVSVAGVMTFATTNTSGTGFIFGGWSSTGHAVEVRNKITDTSGNYFAFQASAMVIPGGSSSASCVGVSGYAYQSSTQSLTSPYSSGGVVGVHGTAMFNNTGLVTFAAGTKGRIIGNTAGGQFTEAAAVHAYASVMAACDLTGDSLYMFKASNPGATGTWTLTNLYGLHIDRMTRATNNFGIVVEGANTIFNNGGYSDADFTVKSDAYDALFIDASNNSIALMNHASGKISFFAATPVTKQAGCAVPTDLATCISAITALRTALNAYGLTTVV